MLTNPITIIARADANDRIAPDDASSSRVEAASFNKSPSSSGGKRTESITWMTPLQAGTSGMITLESLTFTPSSRLISTSAPLTVGTGPLVRSPLSTLPATTWYVRMLVNAGISSRRPSTVPSGSAAKASSVGAVFIL